MFETLICDGARRRFGSARCALAMLGIAAFALPAHADGYHWTGFYAGLNAGGSWSSNGVDIGCQEDPSLSPICADGIADGAFVTSADISSSGFIGGGQVGYNFQTGHWLLGFEADFSGATVDGSTTIPTMNGLGQALTTTLSEELDWLGTVRGRLGFVSGNWLLYGTGGLAYGHSSYDFSFVNQVTGDFARASGSATRVGWTAGGGFEYAFGRWTLKTEYLYYDLGSEQLSAQAVAASTGPLLVFQEPDFETTGHIVRAGVNFPIN